MFFRQKIESFKSKEGGAQQKSSSDKTFALISSQKEKKKVSGQFLEWISETPLCSKLLT